MVRKGSRVRVSFRAWQGDVASLASMVTPRSARSSRRFQMVDGDLEVAPTWEAIKRMCKPSRGGPLLLPFSIAWLVDALGNQNDLPAGLGKRLTAGLSQA